MDQLGNENPKRKIVNFNYCLKMFNCHLSPSYLGRVFRSQNALDTHVSAHLGEMRVERCEKRNKSEKFSPMIGEEFSNLGASVRL